MGELKQTKGYAQFRGILGGLDRVKESISEGKSNKNYLDSDKIKTLKFSVKTSENNVIFVQVKQFKTGNALKNVYISKRDEESGKVEAKAVPFNERHRSFDDGWNLIGVSLKSNNDEHAKSLVPYDAIDYIIENFNDGDSVFISAEIEYTEGSNEVVYKNYEVKRMYVTHDPVDFEDEEFEETSEFEQNIIFNTSYPSEEGLVVQAYTVNYTKVPMAVEFIVKNEDKEVLKYIEKELKTGDLLKVIGIVNNRAVYRYEEIAQDDSGESSILGRKTKREKQKSQKKYEKYIDFEEKNLQIIGLDIDTIKKSEYSEADLNCEEDMDDLPF